MARAESETLSLDGHEVTITNPGIGELSDLATTKDGANAGEFTVGALSDTSVTAGTGTATFTVTFLPTEDGPRSAAIHIASNVSGAKNPFDITLTGTGLGAKIAIEQPTGTAVASGGMRSFGTLVQGSAASLTFTINNAGVNDLTGLTITKDGTHAAHFTVTADPIAPVIPGGTTTFTVQFAPPPGPSTVMATAILHVATNVPSKNPYDINLTGTGLSVTQDTDGDGLNDAAEFLLATQGFNWQTSQSALVSSFLTSTALYSQAQYDANRTTGRNDVISAPNTYGLYTLAQVQALNVDVPLLVRDAGTGQFKLTIAVKKTTDLSQPFVAFPMSAPQTIINAQGNLEFLFTVPDGAAFFRLESQ